MAYIEKFLGKKVEIPEDLSYESKLGLWVRSKDDHLVFGLSEPAWILMNGVNDLEWLVAEGQEISKGESVLFAITGKILYLDAPLEGIISFNPKVKEAPSLIGRDPYGEGWLFKITPAAAGLEALDQFGTARSYINSLKTSEGCKNPEGLKGGVSGICKAVYTGIREQKFERSGT
jgi:glycine cleavage system H protein